MIRSRRAFLSTSAAFTAAACATPIEQTASSAPLIPGAPLKIAADRLTKITVCTRPFRPAGPRLETEAFGDKTVVHNYGHGGSGWSLSWACAEEATRLARQTGARAYAVIGAGVMGLTTAIKLAETGAMVSIYAKDLPSESRSARATGVWSPSSRIALHSAAPAGFADKWEAWARKSYATHQHYIGGLGRPVELQPFYPLRGGPGGNAPEQNDFMHLGGRINDMMPGTRPLAADAHQFPVASARQGLEMVFNVAAYTERLLRDYFALGGRMVRRTFGDRSEALSLPESVIVNCTGYGAKTLWGADELVPVRGQINWMPPQLEARYGLFYGSVYVVSRSDGLVVQYAGPNEDFGFGIEDETPDLEEMQRAVDEVAPLFEGWG
ncbi:MAG: FAD-dependent oxidoreductase [Pseudomonadota bacterium]